MAKSPIPAGHRLDIDAPAFGKLSAAAAKRLNDYKSRVAVELTAEAELLRDRETLLKNGYEMPVSAVFATGRELLARHAQIATREADLFREKLKVSVDLAPEFRRIIVELKAEYEKTVEGILAELRAQGIDGSQWGAPTLPGVQRRLRQFAEEKELAMAAKGRLNTVEAQFAAIDTWAGLAGRPYLSAMRIDWPPCKAGDQETVAQLAGVAVAPKYEPIRINFDEPNPGPPRF